MSPAQIANPKSKFLMRLRFFNTFEPVTTYYRDLLPFLSKQRVFSNVVLSSAEYRQGGRSKLDGMKELSEVKILRIPAFGVIPSGRIKKAFIMCCYILGSIGTSLWNRARNINIFLTQPPLFNLWGLILKALRRQPYICVLMDIYPDVMLMQIKLPGSRMIGKALRRISILSLQNADAVIVIGRCMANLIRERDIDESKIHLIKNWANSDNVIPVPKNANRLLKEISLEDKFVIQYSGNMGISHDFHDFLEVINRLRDDPSIHFVFTGNGARRNEIEIYIWDNELLNTTILDFQSLDRLSESLSLGDVHFVSLREGFEGLVVPSKAYGIMAVGRPMIYQGAADGEIARMIQEEDIGVVVPPDSPDKLKEAILSYRYNQELAIKQGNRARKLTLTKYSYTERLQEYYDLFVQVTNG